MEGITILYEYSAGGPNWCFIICAMLIAVVIAALAIWHIIRRLREQNTFFSQREIVIGVAIALLCLATCIIEVSRNPHTEYKVLIDESVSYVEFIEHYEVVSQEGSIYTIREVKGE